MRYLILADLHANLEALDAVLARSRGLAVDFTVVLGDLVGYGADPNAVVERVRDLCPATLVRGNHDKVSAGIAAPERFNAAALASTVWTSEALTPENRAWLAALPRGPMTVDGVFEACHGSPRDEDAYLHEDIDALDAMEQLSLTLCAFGHTHIQIVYSLAARTLSAIVPNGSAVATVRIDAGATYLVNPEAVGQPRDGDARAAFAVVDSNAQTVELHRVPYPVEAAQRKILAAGLPAILAQRLAAGR